MRSPGARRMIHTRVRSVSDSSVEPTQGFGLLTSRANSAAISAGHCDLSFFSAALSSMLRDMRIPPVHFALIYLSLIHISEPTRLGMISYAVFCLKKKKEQNK